MLAKLRNYLTTGLVVAGPLFITFYLLWQVIIYVDDFLMRFMPGELFGYELMDYTPGLGILFSLVFLIMLGFFIVHFIGASFASAIGYTIDHLPFIRAIYRLANHAFKLAFSKNVDEFGKVVLIENPRRGLWSLAFVSSVPTAEIRNKVGEDCYLVFVPTSPNPTSGLVLVVPKKDAIELEMTKEEAVSIIISIGTAKNINKQVITGQTKKIAHESEKELLLKNLATIKEKIATPSEQAEYEDGKDTPKETD